MLIAKPKFRRLLMQEVRLAFSLARDNAGSNIDARIAIMAMTTRSSIRVNAALRRLFISAAEPGIGLNPFIFSGLSPYVRLPSGQVKCPKNAKALKVRGRSCLKKIHYGK